MPLTDAYARVLIESHPLDVARLLERLEPDEAYDELETLPEEARAPVLESFTPQFAARVLSRAEPEARAELVREIPSEIAADLLPYLSEEVRERLLDRLPALHREEIADLGEYPEDSAGAVMSPEVTALRAGATVADALTRLRRLASVGRSVSYVYVVDGDDRLIGVLLMRDLVLSPPAARLGDIMLPDVARVYDEDGLERVSDVLFEHKLLAVPVVDDRERLVGVVTGAQLAAELQEEGFEDAQKMFGAGSDERASSSAGFAIRKRLPWLNVNLATAFLAAAVVALFEPVIADLTILAAFLPVVAGQGGNAGAQALAVMLRSLALGELEGASLRIVRKEALVGLVNGFCTGVVAGAFAFLLTDSLALALVIFAAMTFNLVIAGAAGAAIPALLERLGQDPAQASNIILTTVTDVIGFASFLGLALLARPWLLGG